MPEGKGCGGAGTYEAILSDIQQSVLLAVHVGDLYGAGRMKAKFGMNIRDS